MTRARNLQQCTLGATAAEFALVLPLLLLLIFGVIDAGRFLWEFNRAEKATQMGARFAVVADPVLGTGFSDYSFSVSDSVPQGAAVPVANFDNAVCNDSSCTCTGGAICGDISHDSTAFGNIVTRIAAIYPAVTASNVTVEYKNVGLGFAGDPNGPDVAPLVTIRLTDLDFHPITCLMFACTISMPDFRAALTAEDLSGSESN